MRGIRDAKPWLSGTAAWFVRAAHAVPGRIVQKRLEFGIVSGQTGYGSRRFEAWPF